MGIGFRIEARAGSRDPALVEALRGIPTSILSDNMSRIFAGGPGLRPMHKGAPLIGFGLTVRTRPGDNLMVHKAIDIAEPGEVIVVDAGGDLTNAIIGEIMTTLARKRGVAGFVIDGAIRDSDALATSDFPVYARGVTHRGPYKDGPGEIGVTISVGGHVIASGDIVVGDADGVLAVPADQASEVAALGRAKLDAEARELAAIADGTVDRGWVDAALRAKGVV